MQNPSLLMQVQQSALALLLMLLTMLTPIAIYAVRAWGAELKQRRLNGAREFLRKTIADAARSRSQRVRDIKGSNLTTEERNAQLGAVARELLAEVRVLAAPQVTLLEEQIRESMGPGDPEPWRVREQTEQMLRTFLEGEVEGLRREPQPQPPTSRATTSENGAAQASEVQP